MSGFGVSDFRVRVQVSGLEIRELRVSGSRLRALGLGLRVSGFGFRASGLGCRILDFGSRASVFSVYASGFGFRVSGFGFQGARNLVEPGGNLRSCRPRGATELGYSVAPYGTAYRRALRTSRISRTTRKLLGIRNRANMAHTRQSRPDSGLGFQVEDLKPF